MPPVTPVAPRRAPVTVQADGTAIVLVLNDQLDKTAAEALVTAAQAAVATDPERVDIDLRQLLAWTEDGVGALVQCRAICGDLPDGLHYRTGRGPGRAALLAAYA